MIGIGIGSTLDSGTNNFGQARIINSYAPYSGQSKAANAKLDIYGEVVVNLGSVPQGQGHETTASQVVAEVLNIPPEMVNVRPGFDSEAKRLHGPHGNLCQPIRRHGTFRDSRRCAKAESGDEPAGRIRLESG